MRARGALSLSRPKEEEAGSERLVEPQMHQRRSTRPTKAISQTCCPYHGRAGNFQMQPQQQQQQQQQHAPSSSRQLSAFITKSLIVKRRRWVLLSCEARMPANCFLAICIPHVSSSRQFCDDPTSQIPRSSFVRSLWASAPPCLFPMTV